MEQQTTLRITRQATRPEPQALIPGLWERPGLDGAPSLEQLDLEIGELAAQIDAASYRLLTAIAEFDRREGWAHAGARSCAHWLSFRISLSLGTARDHVRVARRLEELPRISAAFCRGQLSYSKVRALSRIATPENEEQLAGTALSCTASQLERLVRVYRRVGRAELETAQRQREGRYLQLRTDDDGCLLLEGRLPPEVGAVVTRALEAAEAELDGRADGQADERADEQADGQADGQADEQGSVSAETPGGPQNVSAETPGRNARDSGQRRADALGLVAERALMQAGTGERGEPYQVVVHVDAEVLAEGQAAEGEAAAGGQCHLEGGPSLSAETARRICCDAAEVTLTEDEEGEPLAVGRKSRRVSRALWRVLRSRDQTCAFPGCERTGGLTVHHVTHWAHGGETSRENCVLLCRRCHWLVHEEGFSVRGSALDGLAFENPAGQRLGERVRPPELVSDPVEALQAEHRERGLVIDGQTNLIDWWGEPMDLDLAVYGLLSAQEQEREVIRNAPLGSRSDHNPGRSAASGG
jgi:hypothetical protein